MIDYDEDSNVFFINGKGEGKLNAFEFVKGKIETSGEFKPNDGKSISYSLNSRRCVVP